MKTRYIARIINLTPHDYTILRRFADTKGLGSRGLSAAVRMIIRDYTAHSQTFPTATQDLLDYYHTLQTIYPDLDLPAPTAPTES